MNNLFFWKVWSVSERRMTAAAFTVLLIAIVFFVLKINNPLGNVVRWNVLSELSGISVVIDTLKLGQWQFGVGSPGQLVTESFIASVMEIDPVIVNAFWVLSLTGLSILLAALTTLPRFWYLAGMVLFIALLAFSRLEVLNVLGDGTRTLFLLSVILYGGVSYYFHAFRPDFGISARILGMAIVSILLAVLVLFTSQNSYPALAAASYSFLIWLFLTALFLLISATEIMAGLVWLSTSGSGIKGKSGLINFIVISILYLLLLLLMFLKNTRRVDWDIALVNPVVLALGSAVLGIWGFRQRAESTGTVMPFRSAGFWIYISLFIISAAFGGYVAGTANDPVLETLEDFIIQGQLAMNLLFFFYILVNFFPIFRQRLAVHKVLYKPLRFGLTQTRLFGFAGVVILFSIQRLLPLNQAIAGYFNGLGDLHTTSQEFTLAEQYYKIALQQEFQNHKSNYALASLALKQGDKTAAAFYFRQALLKNPSPEAYAGLSDILTQERLFFDAVHSLQEGVGQFPESGELLNNLGILYSKTNVTDSAYFYLEKAEKQAKQAAVPATNLLAIYTKTEDPALIDSLAINAEKQDYLSWQANWFAMQNLRQKFDKADFNKESVPADSLLSVSAFAYLSNYAANQARHDATLPPLISKLAAKNPVLSKDLSLTALYPEFYSGDKLKALQALAGYADEEDEQSALYHKILGHWLLQLGLYEKAVEAFSSVEDTQGTIGAAVANALAGRKEVAAVLLDKLQAKESSAAIDQLKNTLFAGARPVSAGDSLLKVALRSPSEKTFGQAIQANPFNEETVSAASEFYRKNKQTAKAYKLVLDALAYNEFAPKIWAQYAYLSIDQGLMAQANEGAEKVQQYALPADYQLFASRYQAMRALIEKQRAEFQ